MWKIPLFEIDFNTQEIEAARNVMDSGWLTIGEVTKKFEQKFAEFLNVKHAIAVSSCTSALHLANLALNIGKGDEVICPALSFVSGANSILYTGATPVFADVTDVDNFNISPKDIEEKITEKTRAIQVLHYAGFPCDMNKILDIAKQRKLSIIEDCAHANGASYDKRMCGTIGDVGCFSFFSNKNMTTGEGGMVTTNSDDLAKRIRLMRSHGMTSSTLDRHIGNATSYDVVELGFNYRIDELRAAIGIVQLEKLHKNNIRRKDLAKLYRKRLIDISELKIPFFNSQGISSNHIFPVLLKKGVNRSGFAEYMKQKGIQTSVHYHPVHLLDFYRRNFRYNEGMLPVTEEVTNREVTLPLFPSMKDEDIHYICDVMLKFFQKRGEQQ